MFVWSIFESNLTQSVQNCSKLVVSDPAGGSREFGFLADLLKPPNVYAGIIISPQEAWQFHYVRNFYFPHFHQYLRLIRNIVWYMPNLAVKMISCLNFEWTLISQPENEIA